MCIYVCGIIIITMRYSLCPCIRFDLLSKVASKYTTSVTDKLSQLERMEQDLNTAARSLAQAVEEVNSNARKAQERLERHFGGGTM